MLVEQVLEVTAVKLGMAIRIMGPQSTRDTMVACAMAAEAAGLDDIWISDHIAIPPDDAEGSGGRYLDPLATLAYLAARTERIGLGTSVLNLPYRPPLPTAKSLATIQELSDGRLLLGVGVGWMKPEFRALGVDRSRRGALTDATLEFFHECFANDEVVANGQPFLFRPRPPRPPIFIGGSPPHALRRAIRWGDGWMPMVARPDDLVAPAVELRRAAREAGVPPPQIAVLTSLGSGDAGALRERVHAFREAGATRIIHAARYDTAEEFRAQAYTLGAIKGA